ISMARVEDQIDEGEARRLTASLLAAGEAVETVLAHEDEFAAAAQSVAGAHSLFFLGRGLDWALACEGSLKLKEISYIHCEAYAAGELKHGTISLITEGTPVIALSTQERLAAKMLSNIREVTARGATVTLLAKQGEVISEGLTDVCLTLPPLEDLFMPFPAAAALQLLAYHTALALGCDIDKPRNLAKSVTVE
ncbi:MAG: SIS domain-containing protein, partial [Oscillospiraceae bacterium]